LTGEIDACDDTGSTVEIKTKPAWIHNDNVRTTTNWIQSSMTGTRKMLTAGYYTDKKGPVSFLKNNIITQSLQEYCQSHQINNDKQNEIYKYGSDILHKINDACIKIGTIYEVTIDKKDINNILIKECNNNEFPINDTIIRNTTEAVITIINNNLYKESSRSEHNKDDDTRKSNMKKENNRNDTVFRI